MYKHPWHPQIIKILTALPAERLRENNCYFGGGTALVFQSIQSKWPNEEYRLSDDIDFLCTAKAFLTMRRIVATEGIGAVTGNQPLAREPRIDPYGIRTVIMPPESKHGVKFEIVCDAALLTHTAGAIIDGVIRLQS